MGVVDPEEGTVNSVDQLRIRMHCTPGCDGEGSSDPLLARSISQAVQSRPQIAGVVGVPGISDGTCRILEIGDIEIPKNLSQVNLVQLRIL